MSVKLKKMLEDNVQEHVNAINECASGIFFYGFIAGVIMSYSGFLGYCAGIGTGLFIGKKYQFLSFQFSEKMGYLFQNLVNKVKTC